MRNITYHKPGRERLEDILETKFKVDRGGAGTIWDNQLYKPRSNNGRLTSVLSERRPS